jgi:UDP-2,3-diacylglucosamine pyrophosphatase LpxH
MLVIISDLHLGDGTTAESISVSAFQLFENRLREMAYFASFRKDGTYQPVKTIDVLMLGDVLDPLHSTLWLDTNPGAANFVRPWTEATSPFFANKLAQTTQAIIDHNKESLNVLRRCARGESVQLPPATQQGRPDTSSKEQIKPQLNFHYTVGNHDWYYHLKGQAFDTIRKNIIDTLGLCNAPDRFPYDIDEDPALFETLKSYHVFARHGDCYDKFNFNREWGRDHSTLGDVFTMGVLNRYPVEVQKRFGNELPKPIIDSLRRITNIRPALATSLWISGQLKSHAGTPALEVELKKVWDDLCDEFLQLPFVREQDKAFQFDMVDALELVIKVSKRTSFETLNDIVVWVRDKMSEKELSLAEHALQEPVFLNDTARFIIYGHTHHHEIISLDTNGRPPYEQSQLYINSGTWHSYFDLAIKNPQEQKFVPYRTMTYLTFYKDDEHEGRQFESWSGTYS